MFFISRFLLLIYPGMLLLLSHTGARHKDAMLSTCQNLQLSNKWIFEKLIFFSWGSGGALMRSFRCSGWITWVFFHTCAHLVWVFLLLSTQLYFVIVQAITTNERMRAHRWAKILFVSSRNFWPQMTFCGHFDAWFCLLFAMLEIGPCEK